VALRVVIIPDKFKGTLTAPEAAAAIEKGWRQERPKDRLELIPMSDGGDGFGETLSLQGNGERRRVKTINAAGESIWTPWWWIPKSQTAVIETAQVVGLAQLPKGKYHPFELDSFGLGTLVSKVLAVRPKTLLIGLGGSATNDGGMGMARALGWRFVGRDGKDIESWIQLMELRSIEAPRKQLPLPEVIVAVDVQNRLLGTKGASRVYGPQKGLVEDDMHQSEACLRELSKCFFKATQRNEAIRPGSGAAGGLGFGCFAFLNGKPESGFDVFATRARLDQRLGRADLVITGEGSIDRSSLMGKGVGRVAEWCLEHQTPCIGLGGVVDPFSSVRQAFKTVYSILDSLDPRVDESLAMTQPGRCLTQLAARASGELRIEN
jgi:glycerate kinase